ncbi:PTS fructose IIA subunit, partial [Escherichia coli]|nr:PTS fructose IIA subunit [Escherichia coli]
GTVCVVGKIRALILQLSKSSIYSTKPWQAIWDAEIAPQMEALIKKPGYSMNA